MPKPPRSTAPPSSEQCSTAAKDVRGAVLRSGPEGCTYTELGALLRLRPGTIRKEVAKLRARGLCAVAGSRPVRVRAVEHCSDPAAGIARAAHLLRLALRDGLGHERAEPRVRGALAALDGNGVAAQRTEAGGA